MARRIIYTEAPEMALSPDADPDGTYATWVVDNVPAQNSSRRHTVVTRDQDDRLTVIVIAEDSISCTHLRDLAEAALERKRSSLKVKQASRRGGLKSAATRRENRADEIANANHFVKKREREGLKQIAAVSAWLESKDPDWALEPNLQQRKIDNFLRRLRNFRKSADAK